MTTVKERKSNSWIDFVKMFSSENDISYRDALRHPSIKSEYKKLMGNHIVLESIKTNKLWTIDLNDDTTFFVREVDSGMGVFLETEDLFDDTDNTWFSYEELYGYKPEIKRKPSKKVIKKTSTSER